MSEEIDIVGDIKRHLEREPFEPFVVVMASGDRYVIEAPDRTMVGRSVMLAVASSGGHMLLRLSQISSVEFSGA